MYFIAFKIRN